MIEEKVPKETRGSESMTDVRNWKNIIYIKTLGKIYKPLIYSSNLLSH